MLKENKFLIGLGTLTAVASGGLIYWGLSAGSNLEEVQAEIATQQSALQRMERLDPFPTPQNAEEKAASLADVLTKAREAREKLIAFRPKSLEDIPASAFSDKLKASVGRVSGLFSGEDTLPKGFTLGFKSYAQFLPPEKATGHLAYQLEAHEYLLTQLAESGASEVLNLHRAKIPMEDGEEWPETGAKGSRNKPNKRANKRSNKPPGGQRGRGQKREEVLPYIAHRMPLELTFRASEQAAREFLTRIGNSDQFFFETRLGRVKNPAPIPTAGKSAETSKSSAGGSGIVVVDDGEDDIEIVGDPPVEEKPAELSEKPSESVKILNKVSGGEDLDVFIRLDLLLFIEGKEFPQTK